MFLLIVSQYLLGYIFQGFVCVLGLYAVAKVRPTVKALAFSALPLSVIMILARAMPIGGGIHTIINLIALIALGIYALKLPMPKVIMASILMTLLMFVIETLVFLAFTAVVGEQAKQMLDSDELVKALLGVPINVILLVVVWVVYRVGMRKREAAHAGNKP